MLGLLIRWLLNALALWVTCAIVPGIETRGAGATLVAALVLGILNALVRPILFVLTLPITVLTLGLFTFVLNGLMLALTAAIVEGFYVRSFGAAVLGALVLSLVSLVLNLFVADTGRLGYVHVEIRRG
jgi:putative membrane protein